MRPLLATFLLASSPPTHSSAPPSPDDDCADIRRLDFSPPMLAAPRICVSPGILTGLLFDHPVDVDLQDEVRFAEVTRGREFIGFIPPRDMVSGERLRLTAVLSVGDTRQSLTFVLVAHPGQGSHQVEITYQERSWQSLNDALGQTLLTNRRLSEKIATLEAEAAQAREQLDSRTGLCGAYAGGQLSYDGIKTRVLHLLNGWSGELRVHQVVSYRGTPNVAVEVTLINPTQESWRLEKATLVNARGETLNALRFRQAEALRPGEKLPVFVEFDPTNFALDSTTLTLADGGARTVSIPDVVFP